MKILVLYIKQITPSSEPKKKERKRRNKNHEIIEKLSLRLHNIATFRASMMFDWMYENI